MSDFSIVAEGLGKRYVLGENTSRDRLRQALNSLLPRWARVDEKELWALRGASFTVDEGEAVGIIGANGAGKSTLLKLLSRVTQPTEGRARIRGRVATLLEVGTGFHPELTGRDNIFLSGTILGMTYAEVARKFDDIVAFAEIGDFVDTPVKRYSSGMYVRLAFAVASHLDPEILIVDEVLAVGDAAFQRRSLGRLNDASRRQGRTVLFVSHNLGAIRTFCRRVILLDRGRVVFDGSADEGISRYLCSTSPKVQLRERSMNDRLNRTSGAVRFISVSCVDERGEAGWQVESGKTVRFQFAYEVAEAVPDLVFLFQLRGAGSGEPLTVIRESISVSPLERGRTGTIELVLPDLPLRPNEISLYAALGRADHRIFYDVIDDNVDIPLLRVTSACEDQYKRAGTISLTYRFFAGFADKTDMLQDPVQWPTA